MIYKADSSLKNKLYPMFDGLEDTVIYSCLQGHMGEAWVDDLDNPTVAQITVGIFVFFAGDPKADGVDEMLHNLPDFTFTTVETEEWKKRIEEAHEGNFEKITRYNFEKDPEHLDREHLQNLKTQLPDGYELKKVDTKIANDPGFHELSEDFISNFASIEDFLNRGVGYAILKDDQVVCAATSFSVYDDGIEIEIATHPDFRQKGLATVTASALILDCLGKGKYASWDAANKESVKLAQKLGYVLKGPYDTYVIENEE
ncbi:GNAT family N-acetyltransferase [Halalkalibacillus sediminis]|uniref:GNAT family N-acetyltransferase n=1 Tax=Halalkalibacillus sediminis TaxID=2018042 RepID=A0A2I0QRU9_9BACI|nr:GNAT family N-acetyltransferase [Halalkalibacillus sediminis]PKR76800.1 GNAT family N-acetyltransferase [Halalkalibacillus sediminis]